MLLKCQKCNNRQGLDFIEYDDAQEWDTEINVSLKIGFSCEGCEHDNEWIVSGQIDSIADMDGFDYIDDDE